MKRFAICVFGFSYQPQQEESQLYDWTGATTKKAEHQTRQQPTGSSTMSEADGSKEKKKASICASVTKARSDDVLRLLLRSTNDDGAIKINRISPTSLFAATKLKVGMTVESINGVDMKAETDNSIASLKQAVKLLREAEHVVSIKVSRHGNPIPSAEPDDKSRKDSAEFQISRERFKSHANFNADKQQLLSLL